MYRTILRSRKRTARKYSPRSIQSEESTLLPSYLDKHVTRVWIGSILLESTPLGQYSQKNRPTLLPSYLGKHVARVWIGSIPLEISLEWLIVTILEETKSDVPIIHLIRNQPFN